LIAIDRDHLESSNMPTLTHAERESQQRFLSKYLEQFEQLHQTLVETIGQAEQSNDQLERVYDQLLLRPEHERLQQLQPLLQSMPVAGFNELQQHVQHLVVALQSNRADIDVQLRRCQPPDELRTRRLTRPLLLHTLQQFTVLLERVSLNTRQLHSRLKRIVGKQLKRFHVSLTDHLLERLLHIELDEPLLKLDRFVAIVFGANAVPTSVTSGNAATRPSTATAPGQSSRSKNGSNSVDRGTSVSGSASTTDPPRTQMHSSPSGSLSAVKPVQQSCSTGTATTPPPISNSSTDNRLDEESTAVLWSFCRLVSRCYLSLSGLCVALHTLFEFVASICEHFLASNLIAEVEELPFADIFDFTARIANKMRTDHLKEHEQPILVHPARLQQQKLKRFRVVVISTVLLSIVVLSAVLGFWLHTKYR
jgi:hypothetical protein